MNQDYKTLELAAKYIPKKTDEYMGAEQKAFFFHALVRQKKELESEMQGHSDVELGRSMDSVGAMDEGDAATLSTEADFSIQMQERNREIIAKIDAALDRLENGSFGYSVISGEKIGIKRLMANPTATMTIEEREEQEK
ncbi:MAG: hypothetical protein LBB08_01115 [Rickettsiales bacterium]|jgi:DnaK suppressor protein|nr:hypothetical protein [Rickettsiales bacterium]